MRAPAAFFAAFLLASTAIAQPAAPVTVAGTVAATGADSLSVRTDTGATDTFRLAPNLMVARSVPATLADIRPGDFVASAAVRGTDGKLHSTELRIFPEAMRGLGEGQRPMNDARSQTMTNATVTGTAIVAGANDLRVRFPGGESELILEPGVPVSRLEAVGRDALKPGDKVRVVGTREAAGTTVSRVFIQ
jgi:hypothetical protein